jgi:hypothetical protein
LKSVVLQLACQPARDSDFGPQFCSLSVTNMMVPQVDSGWEYPIIGVETLLGKLESRDESRKIDWM